MSIILLKVSRIFLIFRHPDWNYAWVQVAGFSRTGSNCEKRVKGVRRNRCRVQDFRIRLAHEKSSSWWTFKRINRIQEFDVPELILVFCQFGNRLTLDSFCDGRKGQHAYCAQSNYTLASQRMLECSLTSSLSFHNCSFPILSTFYWIEFVNKIAVQGLTGHPKLWLYRQSIQPSLFRGSCPSRSPCSLSCFAFARQTSAWRIVRFACRFSRCRRRPCRRASPRIWVPLRPWWRSTSLLGSRGRPAPLGGHAALAAHPTKWQLEYLLRTEVDLTFLTRSVAFLEWTREIRFVPSKLDLLSSADRRDTPRSQNRILDFQTAFKTPPHLA